MTGTTGRCTAPDGAELAFAVSGDGPAVVVTAGPDDGAALVAGRAPWHALIEALADRHRVVRCAHRADPGAAPAEVAADLEAVADHLGLTRFALVAACGGAPAGLELTLRRPERVARLALVSPAGLEAATAAGAPSQPVLVLHSRRDPVAPAESVAAFVAAVPDTRLVLADGPHHPVLEDASGWPPLADELRAFLEGALGSAAATRKPSPADLSAFLVTGGALRAGLLDEPSAGDAIHPEAAAELPPLGDELGGRYRLEERIGSGGMGVVYRAFDARLGRAVAIKLLTSGRGGDPHALERFEREARSVSRLSHPNICVLHEIGEHRGYPFLVLELQDGETLDRLLERGPVEPPRALEIAAAVADGLQAAHDAGVIHRDIKPANVMVTRGGHVKILDFGIAKLLPPTHGQGDERLPAATRRSLTRPGTTVGTLAYMSPEQVRDEALDERTDVFSLGAVLYELLSGRRAFDGTAAGPILSAILRDDPRPLTADRLDPRLEAVVARALHKERDRRWPSAAAFRDALCRLRVELLTLRGGRPAGLRRSWPVVAAAAGAAVVAVVVASVLLRPRPEPLPVPSTEGPPAVAVLPFEILAADRTVGYLADAVPDEVTGVLARSHSLAVRPYSETRRADPATFDAASVGAELGADFLVVGRLYVDDAGARVTLEAIEVPAERIVWKDTFELPDDDLLALRAALEERLRGGLIPTLGATADDPGSAPADAEAYRLYLEALPMAYDPEPNAAAIGLLARSVALDPGFAPAWAELGRRRYTTAFYWEGGARGREEARAEIETALELDPDLVEAAGSLIDLLVVDGQVVAAFDTARRLLAHRPASSYGHALMAVTLRYAGLLEEAVAACERGDALDARDPRLRACTWTYLWAGDLDRATEFASRSSSLLWRNDVMARMALMQGRTDEALRRWRRQLEPSAGRLRRDGLVACLEGRPAAELDRWFRADFDRSVRIPDPEWTFWNAGLYVHCGYPDLALVLLRQAAAGGYCVDPSPGVDPLLAPLDGMPELEEIRAVAADCRDRVRAAVQARGAAP